LEEAVEQIKIATRQLARRQMKWFRRFADVRWVQVEGAVDAILAASEFSWPARGPFPSNLDNGSQASRLNSDQ